jgi:hypothetical protein
MLPSSPQLAPRGLTAAHSTTGAPPCTEIFFNLPSAKAAVSLRFQATRAMVNVPTGDILKLPDVPASQFQVSKTALGAVILVGLVSVLVPWRLIRIALPAGRRDHPATFPLKICPAVLRKCRVDRVDCGCDPNSLVDD